MNFFQHILNDCETGNVVGHVAPIACNYKEEGNADEDDFLLLVLVQSPHHFQSSTYRMQNHLESSLLWLTAKVRLFSRPKTNELPDLSTYCPTTGKKKKTNHGTEQRNLFYALFTQAENYRLGDPIVLVLFYFRAV